MKKCERFGENFLAVATRMLSVCGDEGPAWRPERRRVGLSKGLSAQPVRVLDPIQHVGAQRVPRREVGMLEVTPEVSHESDAFHHGN